MYEADATAPALLRTAEFVARLFEAEIRPMALRRRWRSTRRSAEPWSSTGPSSPTWGTSSAAPSSSSTWSSTSWSRPASESPDTRPDAW